MIAHAFYSKMDEESNDFVSGIPRREIIYVPTIGVWAYTGNEIDYFREGEEATSEGEEMLKGVGKEWLYLGRTELSEDIVMKMVFAGTLFDNAREKLEQCSKSLIDLIESNFNK